MSTHRQARRISFGVALGLKRSQISPMACHRMSIVLFALARGTPLGQARIAVLDKADNAFT
jgi:hypothetical protein